MITFIVLPIIIKVSRSIDLLDNPDRRKIHSISTPSLGGVGIFLGFCLAVLITVPFLDLAEVKFFLFGIIIMVMLGVRDDVSELTAKHKLAIQIFAAVMVVYFSDIRLEGFYGILGINQMPVWFNIPFSVFVIVALTNSFNLIDGIDGLAGSVGILILGFLGWVFLATDELAYAVVCISLVGALFAFLFYNWYPSKVFMGDTGSLSMGFVISAMVIHFINVADQGGFSIPINASVGVGMSILILPIYDTSRVFIIRFLNGKNPLDPDRNHLHHGLLKLGFNHARATMILLAFNVAILILAMVLSNYLKNGELILAISGVVGLVTVILELKLSKLKYLKKSQTRGANLYYSKSA